MVETLKTIRLLVMKRILELEQILKDKTLGKMTREDIRKNIALNEKLLADTDRLIEKKLRQQAPENYYLH